MIWIFLMFFPRRENDVPENPSKTSNKVKHAPIKGSHPWVARIMLLLLFVSMLLLLVIPFLPGWDTQSDALYYYHGNYISGYTWSVIPFILLCFSTVFGFILLLRFVFVQARIHTDTEKYGFSPPMRKSAFWFLFWILLQIVLIFSALLIFTIGLANNDWPTLGPGYCVYISCVILGMYVVALLVYSIFVWKYFHAYEIDRITGKCKNCN
ncbi:hypothetical protein B9Z55_021558 [Caenorhabditis nigoni]|uniref:Uncharacterized protein n=1 Tax=Caenorhabditis nigoni TaxID=1611254 RepID=A0A2G5TSM1_9PELO|nr:hypothetical protein B9Z55_021558 [Caenorhabditis nigoni]